MGLLYDVETHTINYHLKKVFSDSELQEDSVIRNFRITAADGKTYNTKHYKLPAIIAVGYKVNSESAVQFRKWATTIIEEYTVKAYGETMGTLLGFKVYSGGHGIFLSYYRGDAGCREILINRQCPNDAKKIWLVRNLLMFTSRYRPGPIRRPRIH